MNFRLSSTLAVGLAAIVLTSKTQAQTLGCTTGGASGVIPTSGTGGGGVYPTTFPPFETVSTLNVASTPAGSTSVTEVKIFGLNHTYTGDLQFVLEDPAGVRVNLWNRPSGGCDFAGDYVVTPVGASTNFPTCTTLSAGSYNQFFGTWPTGTSGVFNADLSAVVPQTGAWKLTVYDWAGGDVGSFTSWDLCFGTPPPPPTPQCLPNFVAGGPIPTSGTGDGTWDTALPTAVFSSTVNVTVPGGATKISSVRINGLNHTWAGDVHMTLTTPAGTEHNLMCRPGLAAGSQCCGNATDLGGDYVIQQSVGNDFEIQVDAGTYMQHFGQWTAGNLGINNTPLETIPISSGNYTLKVYDWAAGDTGAFDTWEFCFDTPSGPTTYCTSGTSTNGCAATISGTANPSVSLATSCVINVTNVDALKTGLLFYGINNTGFTPVSWATTSTSFLCVKAPTQRMSVQNSGGTPAQCDGSLTQDWNVFQAANPGALGNPFSIGDTVFAQAWYRDPPAPKTTNLSNGLQMILVP